MNKQIDGRPILFHFHHKGSDFAIVALEAAGWNPGGLPVALAVPPKVLLLRRVKGKYVWNRVAQSAIQLSLEDQRFPVFSLEGQLKETQS